MYQLIIYAAENTVDYLEDEQVWSPSNTSKAWSRNYVILTFKGSKPITFEPTSKQTILSPVFTSAQFSPSCPHKGPISLNITFHFIFCFLSVYVISTFFYFTVPHTDSMTSTSSLANTLSTILLCGKYSKATKPFCDCQVWIHFGKYIFLEAKTYQSLQMKEEHILGSHKMCFFVL